MGNIQNFGFFHKRTACRLAGGMVFRFGSAAAFHHILGNDIQHLVMASAAAGGAVGDLLDIFKGSQHIAEIFTAVQFINNIEIADLLAVAYHIIFCTHRNCPFSSGETLTGKALYLWVSPG